MPKIPVNNPVQDAMEGTVEQSLPRPYIGYSGLNAACHRATWYGFRWVDFRYIRPQLKRIFERGDIEEARIVKDLKAAGMDVFHIINGKKIEATGAIGEEQEEIIGVGGHVRGHPDGRVLGVPGAEKTEHLLEIKTMKASKFKDYLKHGLEKVHPIYWGQMHSYMGKMKLKRCLFCVTNKDNEERSFKRFNYDHDVFRDMEAIAFDILTTDVPPDKIGDSKWFECKFCDYRNVCHEGKPVIRNCRTCEQGTISDFGTWRCGLDNRVLSQKEQFMGCKHYEALECLNQ
jgi:hypothetical protein